MLAAPLLADRDRWALWLPVALGLGIGLYFSQPAEPPLWIGSAAFAVAALVAVALRRRQAAMLLAVAVAAVALGFAAAQLRAMAVDAPVLERRIGPARVAGQVAEVDLQVNGQRVLLQSAAIDGIDGAWTVRVRLTAKSPAVRPGQWVSMRAVLMPPPQPSAPGAFDFARQAWFQGLGGVGYAVSVAKIEAGAESWTLWLADLRHVITGRVMDGIPQPEGAVAAALMTGEVAGIPKPLLDAYRDSGLAHLLSISGLHMSLVAGLVFMVVRGGLALVPAVALRRPIKKWAAAAAMAATFAYMLIAGAPVPTQRAFLMTGIVLLAVLLDRKAISMRLVAWAAVAVLLWHPEALIGASFQMSFAAVVALIAGYEAAGPAVARIRSEGGWFTKGALYLAGVAATTLIAGTATAVYGVYHFNRFASYSLVANLAAVPITGFWVMPWVLAAFLLMPLGLERLALEPMAWGLRLIDDTAVVVAGWPGAALSVPAMPVGALIVFTLGGAWLCLWRGRWRLLGIAGMAGGLALSPLSPPPDLLVDGEGKLMAVKGADGGLTLSTKRGGRITRETWLRRNGEGGPGGLWPATGRSADGLLSCDPLGCLYTARGATVALVKDVAALGEDCGAAAVVVSAVPVRAKCASAGLVIDRFDLWRGGAHALWLGEGGQVRAVSVADWQGRRPWSRIMPDEPKKAPADDED